MSSGREVDLSGSESSVSNARGREVSESMVLPPRDEAPSVSPRGFKAALDVDNELLAQTPPEQLPQELWNEGTPIPSKKGLGIGLGMSPHHMSRIQETNIMGLLITILLTVILAAVIPLLYGRYTAGKGEGRDSSEKKHKLMRSKQDDTISFEQLEQQLILYLKDTSSCDARHKKEVHPKSKRLFALFERVLQLKMQTLQNTTKAAAQPIVGGIAVNEKEGIGETQVVNVDAAGQGKQVLKHSDNNESHKAVSSSANTILQSKPNGDGSMTSVQEEPEESDSAATTTTSNLASAVAHLTQTLSLDLTNMDTRTKLQLVQTAAQCLYTESQNKQVEISTQSLSVQKEHKKVVQEAHKLNVSEMNKRTFNTQVKHFKASLADSLVAGILMMVLCMSTKIFNFLGQWTIMLETCANIDAAAGVRTTFRDPSSQHNNNVALGRTNHYLNYFQVWSYTLLHSFFGKSVCMLKLVLAKAGGYIVITYCISKLFHQLISLTVNYQKAPITILIFLFGLVFGQLMKTCVFHWQGNTHVFLFLWILFCCTHCY